MKLPSNNYILIGIGIAVTAIATVLFTRKKENGNQINLSVDSYAAHEPATEFDPEPKKGTLAFRMWALNKWGERPGSPENISRWDNPDKPSEHHEGRAWDLMTNNLEHGQSIVDELLAPEGTESNALARRAGIMYMIWNKRIWRSYPWSGVPAGSWGDYTGPNPHTDHVHFSFSRAGGNGDTSLYAAISPMMPAALVYRSNKTLPMPTD